MSSNNSNKIVLITGANQGLGLAIIEVAGKRYPSNTFILCARNIEKGQQAVQQLRSRGVSAAIDVVKLDVTNDNHIADAVKHVDAQYGRLDSKYTIRLRFSFSRNAARDNARLTKGDGSPRQQRWFRQARPPGHRPLGHACHIQRVHECAYYVSGCGDTRIHSIVAPVGRA
jgi:hypothetical protein